MKYSTTVGVDLAKNIIQLSVVSGRGKELLNRALTRRKFAEFLGKQKPSLVAFEACATSHHWARTAKRHGHFARIIPAKAVAPFRQGHKTDSNDALAVAEAARRPNIKDAPMKTIDQQGLQAIQRSRDLLVQESTALSNAPAWLANGIWGCHSAGICGTATHAAGDPRGRCQRGTRSVSAHTASPLQSLPGTARRYPVDER
jgi:transposase